MLVFTGVAWWCRAQICDLAWLIKVAIASERRVFGDRSGPHHMCSIIRAILDNIILVMTVSEQWQYHGSCHTEMKDGECHEEVDGVELAASMKCK